MNSHHNQHLITNIRMETINKQSHSYQFQHQKVQELGYVHNQVFIVKIQRWYRSCLQKGLRKQ